MATIKFSEFDAGNISSAGVQVVGLEGGTNKRFTAADLVNGLATVTYVDAQDVNLQNQITQNTNDIANIDLDTGNVEANIAILQGQVTIIEGNIVVLEGAVAALQNNVSINQSDIVTLQGNITLIEQQIADLEANGNIQTLSLDNSSNVLSISGGNTVDFTTVLANVVGADAQTLSWDTANSNLSISGGNTVTIETTAQTLSWDQANSNLSISDGNSVLLEGLSRGQYIIESSSAGGTGPNDPNVINWMGCPSTNTAVNRVWIIKHNTDDNKLYSVVSYVGSLNSALQEAGFGGSGQGLFSGGTNNLTGCPAHGSYFPVLCESSLSFSTLDDVPDISYLADGIGLGYAGPEYQDGLSVESIGIGVSASVLGGSGIAIGASSTVVGSSGIAIGLNAEANSTGDIAFGEGAVAGGGDTIAIGRSATANSSGGIAIGELTDAGEKTVAIGDNAGAGTLSTSNYNVWLGFAAGYNSGGIDNSLILNATSGLSPATENGHLLLQTSHTKIESNASAGIYFTDAINGTVSLTSLIGGGGGGGNYSNANVLALGEAGWGGNIIPSANITYDLGTPTNRWKDLYLSNATIYLGQETISINNEGTMVFSGNISAQNIIDETSLIIHGGVINTTQAGTTDGLEWQAIDLPGHSPAFATTKMATNGSGILAAGQNGQLAYSLDNGDTWQLLNPRIDLSFPSNMSNIRVHYISSLDTFFIGGNQGYYFTTQDFVSFSGQLRANPGAWNGIQGIADNGTNLVLISASRIVHYIPLADLSNDAGWTSIVNNLTSNSGWLTYNGTRFVIVEYGSNAQSSTDGVTWVNKTATGLSTMRGVTHDETGKIVAVGENNKFAVSTDDGVTWTTTDISSQVEWGATTNLADVAYGDGLWIVSGENSADIQYVSEDLVTWSKIQTNAIGGRNISYMSYTGDAFYGQNQDGNYKLEWPLGKQLLLFNGNVIATRSDISYAVSSAKVSSAEHLSTAWLTITPDHDGSNANANVSNVSHSEIVFNSADTSLDITSNAQPVAKITSGVLVQVHGSWDATAAGSFNWATDEIASHGINTVTRDAVGIYTVEFETPFATNAYTVTTGCGSIDYSGTGASPRTVSVLTRTAANCTVICERTDDAVNEDNLYMSLMVCGVVATQ